ncbi:TetR/AcrR family transcriptional regulator C-terminal domain-containing protein [Streptomyces sp. NPDC004647]|uniref:TetR/AcrR family transcriptional regulator C-terminal domain-containing protein n=1 Tax=Streptomyces sp. NPDC004647 TaxID=3154671 RepID=UPI0033BE4741
MPSTKQSRRRLTRGEILQAAAAIADRVGLESLTMRTLATEIRSDPTAVYRHFRDKQELLDALVDHVLGDLRYPSGAQDWRAIARELALSLRDLLRAHPGVAMLIASGPPTPGSVEATAKALHLLDAAGVPPELAVRAHRSVISYVVGWVLIEQNSGAQQGSSHFAAALLLAQQHPSTDPTAVARATAPDRSAPGEFEFGLDAFLDGLTAHLPAKLRAPA